ncbi:hypothetical protein PF008_g19865 [Phytophthora fragariae]|uniref:Uncharacterized protein n=1 Tax=Phytophthora fragariae TaxID=53985 RepID=A0A6G0R158_9STRA|nr:hypothetical protein PF008_g19865 [Phytophthora fragariae]
MVAKRTRGSGVDASNDGDKGKGHDDLPVGPRAATPAGDAAPPAAPASTGKVSTQPVQAVSASSIGAAKHDRAGGKSSGEGGAAGPAALAGPALAAGPAGSGPPAHAPAATALATFARATGAAAAPKAKRKRTQTSRSGDKRLRRFSPHEVDRSASSDSPHDPTLSEVDDFEKGGVVEDADEDGGLSDTEDLPAHLTFM